MSQGEIVEKDNGKWVYLLDEAGSPSREFDDKPSAEKARDEMLGLVNATKKKASSDAEAEAEADADYQRRAAIHARMRNSQQI